MPIRLSPSEFDYVQTKRQTPRPARYSAGLGSYVQVGLDFEAFLILTPVGKKAAAANWINIQMLDLDSDLLRDMVADDFMSREIDEVESQQQILSLLTDMYEEFRTDFIDERFQEVNEVAVLLEDTRVGADRIFSQVDNLEHRRIMATAMQTRYASGSISEEQRRQASSWSISLLTPYL